MERTPSGWVEAVLAAAFLLLAAGGTVALFGSELSGAVAEASR
jgi:hypothetical protein